MKSADDITERERSEAALRASEARYRTLFESIEARQAFLLALSDALRPLADSAEMERTAMRLLGEELGVDRAFYATIDDDGKYWSIQHDYANGLPSNAGRYPMSEFQRKRLMEWQQGHVTSIADSETDPLLTAADRAAYALVGARAGIGVPLVKGGRFAALLALNQTEPREWTAAELALTNEVAERTWAEIERARAEDALRTSKAQLTAIFDTLPVGVGVIDATGTIVLYNREMRRFLPTGVIPSRDNAREARWHGFDANGRQVISSDFPGSRALQGERMVPGIEMLYTDDGGTKIWTRVSSVPTYDRNGQLTGGIIVVTDIDALKRAETVLRESQERQAFLLTLNDALRPLADAEIIQREALHLLRVHLGVPRVLYAEALDQDGAMRVMAESLVPGLPPMEGSIFHFADFTPDALTEARAGRPLWRDDVQRDDHTPEQQAAYTVLGTRAWAMIPLVKEGRFVAELAVHAAEARAWTPQDLQLIQEVTERTWAAVEHARVEVALRTLNETLEQRMTERTTERDTLRRQLAEAEEGERRRLARELHDQLGQELTAFRLGIDDALRLAATHNGADASSTGPLLNRLTSLQAIANHMTMVARSIAIDLRPLELDDVGLGSAIETYVREWSLRYDVATEVAATGLDACAAKPEVTSAVYRILQEALTNVAKHAGASSVSVIGGCSNNELRLVIEDNGRGFDTTAARDVGFGRQLGVAGMKERAALVDGTANVESTDDGGTTVYIRIPIGTAAHV